MPTAIRRVAAFVGYACLLFAAYHLGYKTAVSDVIGALAGMQSWWTVLLDWKLAAAAIAGIALLMYGRLVVFKRWRP